MHHLMSLKLVSSSFNVIPVSLNGSRKIKTRSADEDFVTNDSLLDVYAKRAQYAETIIDIISLNFISFATKYKLVINKLSAQSCNSIPRIFPVYSSNAKGPNFGLYCKYQRLRYKPWQTTQDNAWGDQPGSNEIYITSWKNFLETQYAKEHVPDWCEKLQNSQNVSEDQNDSDSSYSEQLPEREEWMHLADIIPGSFVNTTKEIPQPDCNNYNWHGDRHKYADYLIGEIPSWIKLNKDTFSIAQPQQNIDINTFNDMQAHAYNMVKGHSQHPCPKDQLLLIIVVGVAGTGKSYLINVIRNLLGTSCALTATTGKAAFNINGCTIHSLLKLPIGSKGNKALTTEGLVRLQNNLKGITYIIIDEYSMLG